MELNKIYNGDSIEVLKTLPSNSISCCVTSPPYFGLRDYGVKGQIGLEASIDEYIDKLVMLFREVRRVLREDGVIWINIGDSYNTSTSGGTKQQGNPDFNKNRPSRENTILPARKSQSGLQNKDLIGVPWRVAFALQSDGWILRQDIIWHKPNPMPESIKDRFTKSHEYIFMFVKSQKYYFDSESVKEASVTNTGDRNRRSVWTISVAPYKGAHFATFPVDLIEPCIVSTCPEYICSVCGKPRERLWDRTYVARPNGDELEKFNHERGIAPGKGQARNRWSGGNIPIQPKSFIGYSQCDCNSEFNKGIILDPFMGAGTTAICALKNNRNYIGIELNPEYINIAQQRINSQYSNTAESCVFKEGSRFDKLI